MGVGPWYFNPATGFVLSGGRYSIIGSVTANLSQTFYLPIAIDSAGTQVATNGFSVTFANQVTGGSPGATTGLSKTDSGTLSILSQNSAAPDLIGGDLRVTGGVLQLANSLTASMLVAGAAISISGNGTLTLAGDKPAFGSVGPNVDNESTAPAGLIAASGNQVVGQVTGVGGVTVNGGASLTASKLDAGQLVIGGQAGAYGTFTLAPSSTTSHVIQSLALASAPAANRTSVGSRTAAIAVLLAGRGKKTVAEKPLASVPGVASVDETQPPTVAVHSAATIAEQSHGLVANAAVDSKSSPIFSEEAGESTAPVVVALGSVIKHSAPQLATNYGQVDSNWPRATFGGRSVDTGGVDPLDELFAEWPA